MTILFKKIKIPKQLHIINGSFLLLISCLQTFNKFFGGFLYTLSEIKFANQMWKNMKL